jgi:hypothetical protein
MLRRAGGEESGVLMLGVEMEKDAVLATRWSKGDIFYCQIDLCILLCIAEEIICKFV